MVLKKLTDYLNSNNIKYVSISHSQAFTSEDIALAAHIPDREIAKTVMVKVDDKMIMVVIPGSDMVSFKTLKKVTGGHKIGLAAEQEFESIFPGCELGAMPPFGNLFGLEVFVAENLSLDKDIAFNAGTHRELIKMSYKDFEKLVNPKIMNFSIKKRHPEDDHWTQDF